MQKRFSRWYTTLVELRLPAFSTLLWIGAAWFIAGGIAVLIHRGLSNWNAPLHLVSGAALLTIASSRFVYRWNRSTWPKRLARLIPLALIVVLASVAGFTIYEEVRAHAELDGKFATVVEGQTFDALRWAVIANIEDFAEFATVWHRPERLAPNEEREIIKTYFAAREAERSLERRYDIEGLSTLELASLKEHKRKRQELDRPVERILSRQIADVFDELGLTIPWLHALLIAPQRTDFRFVAGLNRLIIAERDKLEIYQYVGLDPELTVEERDEIEEAITQLRYSAYVKDFSGEGKSPSLIVPGTPQGTLRVLAHERIHVWFFFVPHRDTLDPEQRVIEETVASLLGDAIGKIVYCRIFDDPSACTQETERPVDLPPDPNRFDHRVALRETYLTAEAMLKEGRIEEAEAYMEERRQWMCEQGHCERVVNQAFFADKGAYADSPSFEDAYCRLGAKIQELWNRSESIGEFYRSMQRIRTREDLEIVLYGSIDKTCDE